MSAWLRSNPATSTASNATTAQRTIATATMRHLRPRAGGCASATPPLAPPTLWEGHRKSRSRVASIATGRSRAGRFPRAGGPPTHTGGSVRRVQLKRPARLLGSLAVLAVVLTACSSATSSAGVTSGSTAPTADAKATFTGHGSIGQAYVLGAPPGTHLVLANAAGTEVGSGTADGLGSLILRNVTPGAGYTFRSIDGQKVEATSSFTVLTPSDTPPESFYSIQHLSADLNYITMRDGVKLAATVRLPPGKTLADGPFPTVIEESGYAIAAPHSLIDALLHPAPEGTPSDPLLPDTGTVVGSVLTPLLGFA